MNDACRTLIAINEAIHCLDRAPLSTSDGILSEVQETLLAARSRIYSKEWPELPLPVDEAWFWAREFEQRTDGRL